MDGSKRKIGYGERRRRRRKKEKKGQEGEEEHQIKGPEKEGLRSGGMRRGAVRKVQRGQCLFLSNVCSSPGVGVAGRWCLHMPLPPQSVVGGPASPPFFPPKIQRDKRQLQRTIARIPARDRRLNGGAIPPNPPERRPLCRACSHLECSGTSSVGRARRYGVSGRVRSSSRRYFMLGCRDVLPHPIAAQAP